MSKITKGKISLLGFELRQALAKGDTSSANGRVRVFEQVRGIMAGATSVKEREEEIPFLADTLRLTPESVSLLLQSRPGPTQGRPGTSRGGGTQETPLGRRVLGQESSIERDFLVAAVCNLDRAGRVMEVLTPDHFADPGKREVFVGLKEAVATGQGDRDAVLAALQVRAKGDSETGPLFVRLVMEADRGVYPPAALEELHLRLQEQYFVRQINSLRATLEDEGDVASTQKRLVGLERLLQKVRINLTELDPDAERL